MLSLMRSKAAGWVSKIFIALIALSFAVWGISDMFTGMINRALVTVGDREISPAQYQSALQQRLRVLSERTGRTLTTQEARQYGIDVQVLNDLVRQTALEEQADNLGLAVPDMVIAERTAAIPAFRDAAGHFDRNTFLQVLRANGLTEAQFIAMERSQLLRQSVASPVERNFEVPNTLVKAAFEFQNSERTGRYIVLPLSLAGDVAAPTEDEIKAYYEENKRAFTAPEFRALTVVRLEPADIASSIEITDAEVEKAYQERIGSFTTPEKRTILQIPFKDEAEAKAARAKLQSGADFEAFAKERGLTEIDYNLGNVTRSQLPDKNLADAAFSLQPGQISQPVEGRLATVLLKVKAVEPAVVKPLAEVRDELVKTLQLEKAREEISALHDKFEDERASGLGLKEAAEALDLPVIQVDAVDRSGHGPDGQPIANIPALNELVASAFESDIGVENDAISTDDEGYVWYEVVDVVPEAIKPLEDVRAEIIERITDERRQDALQQIARDAAADIREGRKTFEQVAQEYGLTPSTTPPLRRGATAPGFGQPAVTALFSTPENGVGMAFDPSSKTALLIQPASITTPEFNPQDGQVVSFADALRNNMADDLFGQYLSSLESTMGVNVNSELWSSIIGSQS